MLFPRRPWRFALGFTLFWVLTAWPLLVAHNGRALALLSGFIVAQAAFVWLRPYALLSWIAAGVSLGLLLLALPQTTESLTPLLLYALGMIGMRLTRRWVLVVGVPLSVLMMWGSQRFRPVGLLDLLLESTGLLAVIFLGHAIASLRESRDESRALAEQLRAANAALRLQAGRDAELSRLHERERLARELHDTLGHALSTLTVQLEAARRLQGRNPEAAGRQLADAQTLSRQAMQDLRAALDDLRQESPPDLDALIRALAEPLAVRHGWQLELDISAPELPPQLVSALRPVLAEALMNVARHAGATRVWVRARGLSGALMLSVEDDGVGVGPAPEAPGHYGLLGMRERLEALAGTLSVGPRPGGGTRLGLKVPLRAAAPVTELT